MGVIANRSYIEKMDSARIFCSVAAEDAYILTEIAADVFSVYEKDAFLSFRQEIPMGNASTGSELTGDESEAQVVIAIISSNYLNQKTTDAGMVEFRYAVEHNIPILPIVIEAGLEDTFNHKCGKLELIFKYQESYAEILRENLNRLLLGGEIKKQIREHFYGSIFLSYRRLDLARAKETMKMVHGFDRCQDIGIWYDGALVPGKDYEEEIFEHLERCDCVLMMVTARFLEAGNFIMNEFPRVKAAGMKILPYLVEDVDLEQLSEAYPGILDEYPCGIRGEEQLQSVLYEIFPSYEGAWSGETNYFIGLANLYGVDFEHDTEKAIHYLQRAAEAGYQPALVELVRIYDQGIGIASNRDQAILYQEKYVAVLKKNQTTPLDIPNRYAEEVLQLGRLYEKNNDDSMALANYQEIITESDFELKHGRKKEYYLFLAKIYEAIGLLAQRRKDFDGARENLFYAEKCMDNADRVTENQEERDVVAYAYSRIAEEIAMMFLTSNREGSLVLADTYIQIAIRPYEENCRRDDFDNVKKEILSRLYYEEACIEREKLKATCKDGSADKEGILDQLDWIGSLLHCAMEFCTETDFNESVRNVEAYHSLILILEELKNTHHLKFKMQATGGNLSRYESDLREMMHILMNVNRSAVANRALANKINECVWQGNEFAEHHYDDKAIEFYQLALEGMRKNGSSEQSYEIKTVKGIIEQLS